MTSWRQFKRATQSVGPSTYTPSNSCNFCLLFTVHMISFPDNGTMASLCLFMETLKKNDSDSRNACASDMDKFRPEEIALHHTGSEEIFTVSMLVSCVTYGLRIYSVYTFLVVFGEISASMEPPVPTWNHRST